MPSTGNPCRPALDDAFDFCQGGHGQRAVGHAAADGPFDGLAGEQAVDEAGGKAVSAADAVQNVDLALRDVDDLVIIESDGAPGVAAGGVGGAQGAGDELEVRISGSNFAQHLFVAGDGQLGKVLADAFDVDAEHGGEVLFVAEEQIDLADQFAVDFLGFGLASDGLPEGFAVIEVVGDRGCVAAGGVHSFGGHFGGGGGERGEDAAGVKALRAVLGSEDRGPVEVAGFELADGGVAAVGTAGGGAEAEASLSEVEAVADGAAYAVIGNPFEQGSIDAALEDEVFHQ